MATATPRVGKRLVIAAVLIAACIAAAFFFRSTEFHTVPAVVVSAEETCHFRTFEGSNVGRRNSRRHFDSAPLPCEEARQLEAAGQSGKGSLQEITFIRLTYRAPADGQDYSGELRAWRNDYPGVKRGDRIDIRIHKRTGELLSAGGL